MNSSSSENLSSSLWLVPAVVPGTLPPWPEDFDDHSDPGAEVAFVPDSRRFLPWLAALSSQRISYRVSYEGDQQFILVPKLQAQKAWDELIWYEKVNFDWPHPDHFQESELRPLVTEGAFFSVILVAALLAKFYYLAHGLEDQLWFELGRNDAMLFGEGQWWRVITALTLHADISHLVSNLVWGVALGVLIASDLGVGAGFLAMLLSGVIGNLLATLLATESYRSLGASTMVFGMLGMICAIRAWDNWQKCRRRAEGRLTRMVPWLPLLAGLAMFGMYGTAAGTDLLGHAFGFLAGVAIGVTQPGCRKIYQRISVQIIMGATAVAIVALAWKAALLA